MICGDYNSRTNVISDTDASINGCDGDLDNLVPLNHSLRHQVIESMYAAGKLSRFSMDKAPWNKYGSRLIQFNKVTDMLIFNGSWVMILVWGSLLEMVGVLSIMQQAHP